MQKLKIMYILTPRKVAQLITEITENSAKKYEESIFSVYRKISLSLERIEQVGTAFLYESFGFTYLITAHHVIESCSAHDEIYFLNKKGLFLEINEFVDFQNKKIYDKNIDLCVFRLKISHEKLKPISCDVIASSAIPDPCISIGFPNTKNQDGLMLSNINEGKLAALRLQLYDQGASNAKAKAGDDTFFYKYHGKYSLNSEWRKTNSVRLCGMSGAPCFSVKIEANQIANNEYCPEPLIAGILIEYERNSIKFVRFDFVKKLISKTWPNEAFKAGAVPVRP